MATVLETRAEAARTSSVRERLVRPLPDDRLVSWIATGVITLLAGLLRLWHLSQPRGKMFDEIYYACDSQSLLKHGVEVSLVSGNQACAENSPLAPGFVVHPPLGKWLIGIGQSLFGYNETGWRIVPAILGTLSVLVLIRVARRMFHSTLLGCVAGLLLAVDGLHFVLSRTALLDGMLTFFIILAFACLVADRDWGRRRLADLLDAGSLDPRGPRLGIRWWRLACAASLGAAVATKWSGVFYLLLFPLLALAWDVGARRSAGILRPGRAALRQDVLPLAAAFVLIPLVLYTASWTGWFVSGNGWDRHYAQTQDSHWPLVPDAIRSWIHYHHGILRFHSNLESKHPYQSHPLGWLLLARPVAFFYTSPKAGELGCSAVAGCSREVLGVGNPIIWWASVPCLGLMAWYWLSRRDWRAGAIGLTFLVGFLPWLYYDAADHRTMFLFYALPGLPFMILAITYVLGRAIGDAHTSDRRRTWGTVAAGSYVLVAVIVFFQLYPVLAGEVIPYSEWRHLMWFGNNWI